MQDAARRLRVLSGHLPPPSALGGDIELSRLACAAADQRGNSAGSSSYASATGTPSSYARVHGEVSRKPAQWNRIQVVAKEQLEDIKYEKAQGEGIAKVRQMS